MTSAPSEPLFHCPRSADLALQVWPDGAVVYDDANGGLHALTPVAGQVLQAVLGRSDFAAPDLALELLQDTPDAQDLDRMRELLSSFETLGFVERCPG